MPCRHYIPILKDYPNRYIYEPWNAPESVQKAANCVVGVDYPKPMINHAEGSRLNIERMKQVYQQLSHYRGLSKSAYKINKTFTRLAENYPTQDVKREELSLLMDLCF